MLSSVVYASSDQNNNSNDTSDQNTESQDSEKSLASIFGCKLMLDFDLWIRLKGIPIHYKEVESKAMANMGSEEFSQEQAVAMMHNILTAYVILHHYFEMLKTPEKQREFLEGGMKKLSNSIAVISAVCGCLTSYVKDIFEKEISIEEVTERLSKDKELYKKLTIYGVYQFIINERVIAIYMQRNNISEPLTKDNIQKYTQKYVEYVKKVVNSKNGQLDSNDLKELLGSRSTVESYNVDKIGKAIADALRSIQKGTFTKLINITGENETDPLKQNYILLYKIDEVSKDLNTREKLEILTNSIAQERLKASFHEAVGKGLLSEGL